MDQAVSFRISDHLAAVRFGQPQPPREKSGVDLFSARAKYSEADLRRRTVMADADRAAAVIDYLNSISGLRAAPIGYVTSENPRVTGCDAIGALAVDPN